MKCQDCKFWEPVNVIDLGKCTVQKFKHINKLITVENYNCVCWRDKGIKMKRLVNKNVK